ncbi:unnamed protein product [Pleuronectes platessa]|uniref:Uncharacterized protein n=1 Tax=Pleuronectes platessa TaxID=8262 RepID=A0A9N7V2V4_PLEPL|nr:unnamed protein product [Pleuronectes platessa]
MPIYKSPAEATSKGDTKPLREVGSDTVPFLPTHILAFLPAYIHKQKALTATARTTEPTVEPQTMKVFNKKRVQRLMIFASAGPGGGRRWAAATCHWEHCTLLRIVPSKTHIRSFRIIRRCDGTSESSSVPSLPPWRQIFTVLP